jgi:glutamate synthase domain-containing protein 3
MSSATVTSSSCARSSPSTSSGPAPWWPATSWENALSRFVKVMPRDYKRALEQGLAAQEQVPA